jgi:pimeloyl-ACP methyl ester carboxylesterase
MLTFCHDSSDRLAVMRKMFSPVPGAQRRVRVLFAALAVFACPSLAAAEAVQIKPSLLKLNANLEVPAGKKVEDGGVVIILHGTLSHAGQETIVALQKNLKAREVASLAITLSLGIDDRQGPRACGVVHDYALAGTRREIGLWMEWLSAQHAKSIDLLGFSNGGAQVAALAPELAKVRRIILVAPAFANSAEQETNYQRAFGHPLKPELEEARKVPLEKRTVDFLTCKQAPVLGATFLDGYAPRPASLAARTGHPTLVVVAGKDEVVPELKTKLPSDVKPVVIEGAGHFFPDLFNEEAADAIAKFIKTPRADLSSTGQQ